MKTEKPIINKELLINQIIHHSLEVKLAKALKRKIDKTKPAIKALFGEESHDKLVNLSEVTTCLTTEIERHMKILLKLSIKLLDISRLTNDIDAQSIVPFKLKEIEQGFVHIPAPVDSNKNSYDIILNLGEIVKSDDDETTHLLHESYSQVPKGYRLLLLID